MYSSGPILHTAGLSGTQGEFTDIVTINKGTDFTVSRALRGGKFWTLKTCTHPDTASLQMLRREYEISRNFRHPFILNAIGLEDTPAGVAIVTEYVEGRTLAEYLAEKPSATDRHKVFGQILDAVTYLHRKSVTHNDLKAENILVSAVGDNVVLIDFGMAESSAHHLTHHLGGTAGTSAPEVMDGNPDAKTDARTDIYSLGILLSRMFGATGQTPQNPGTAVGSAHCTGKYRRTIRKSTSSDPEGRPASIEEFRAAMARDERRPVILACLAALVVLCALAATLLTTRRLSLPDTQEQDVTNDTTAVVQENTEADVPDDAAERVAADEATVAERENTQNAGTEARRGAVKPAPKNNAATVARANTGNAVTGAQPDAAECPEDPMLEEIRTVLGRFAKESIDSMKNSAIAPWQEYGYNVLGNGMAKYLSYKFSLPESLHFASDTICTRLIVIPLKTILCQQMTLYDAKQAGLISDEEYNFHLENSLYGGFYRPFPGNE